MSVRDLVLAELAAVSDRQNVWCTPGDVRYHRPDNALAEAGVSREATTVHLRDLYDERLVERRTTRSGGRFAVEYRINDAGRARLERQRGNERVLIPIAFEVKRRSQAEDHDVDRSAWQLVKSPGPDEYRVEVKLLDVQTGRGYGFSALVVRDSEAPAYGDLMTVFEIHGGPGKGHRDYMRRVRDAINRELGEES